MFINEIFPEAIAWFEDVAFIRGSGVGEPLGFLNAAATVTVNKEAGQASTTLVWENLVKMYARMLPSSLASAVWIAHIDTFPELATMSLSVGTGGSAIWLNNGVQGPPMTILGRPVLFTEKANSLGTAGDINFVDLSYYLIGDRQAIQADTSPHYRFQSDQTTVRFIERVDGRPWIQSAITPNQGSGAHSHPSRSHFITGNEPPVREGMLCPLWRAWGAFSTSSPSRPVRRSA
jgi:HK97 family phage major capsid protein